MTDYSKLTDEQLMALLAPTRADIAADAGKGLLTGAAEGGIGLLGLPGDALELADKAMGKTAPKTVPANYVGKIPSNDPPIWPTSARVKAAVEDRFGKLYDPTTMAGEATRTIGSMWPAAIPGGGGAIARTARVVVPGLTSEAAGHAAKDTWLEPYMRVAGALAGVPSVGGRIITPLPSSPERARLAAILADEGVTSTTAGQRTGNKTLQYAESILGDFPGAGGRTSTIQQEGQRQFTGAAMRRAGTGPNAAPEVLAENSARLGREFEDLSARNAINFDPQFVRDAAQAVRSYQRVPNSQQRTIVEGYVNDIADHMRAGGMPGTYYQEMRSRLSRQSNNLRNSDPTLSEALGDLRDALDNAMRRSMSPDDIAAWDRARQEYAAQKTLENSASRAGEATGEGNIVPANLRNEAATRNRGAYARGEGDFSELARAGSTVMAPLPNSGTGQRVAINTATTGLGAGLGAAFGGGGEAALAAGAGAAAPAVAGRVLMHPWVQGYLGNQVMSPVVRGTQPKRDALVQLLMSEPRLQLQSQ